MASNRNVRIRYTRDGAWPKGAEVIVREDRVPAEAEVLCYETGELYEQPKPPAESPKTPDKPKKG